MIQNFINNKLNYLNDYLFYDYNVKRMSKIMKNPICNKCGKPEIFTHCKHGSNHGYCYILRKKFQFKYLYSDENFKNIFIYDNIIEGKFLSPIKEFSFILFIDGYGILTDNGSGNLLFYSGEPIGYINYMTGEFRITFNKKIKFYDEIRIAFIKK